MALTTAQRSEVRLADAQVWADADAQALLDDLGAKAVVKLRGAAQLLGASGEYDEAVALWTIHLARLRLPHLAMGAGETTSTSDALGGSRSSSALVVPPGLPLDLVKTTAGQRLIGLLSSLPRGPILVM